MWAEENLDAIEPISAGAELRGAGITPGGMSADMDNLAQSDPGTEELQAGEPGAAPTAPTPGAAPTAPAPGAPQ
jgi:hypothetical protein